MDPRVALGLALSAGATGASAQGFRHPVGVLFSYSTGSRLQADASGGVVWFARPFLAANATHFNLTAALGVGVRVEMPGGTRAVVGYRVHHTSNGGLGEVCPGIDARQIYVGFWLR